MNFLFKLKFQKKEEKYRRNKPNKPKKIADLDSRNSYIPVSSPDEPSTLPFLVLENCTEISVLPSPALILIQWINDVVFIPSRIRYFFLKNLFFYVSSSFPSLNATELTEKKEKE